MKTRYTYQAAFTLVELLVVVAIILLMAALLFPVLTSAREKSRQTTCVSNLHQIGLAIGIYNQDYDGYFPYAISPVEKEDNFWYSYSPSFARQVPFLPEFNIVIQPYVNSQKVFKCPSDHGFDNFLWPRNAYSIFLDAPNEAHPSAYIQWNTSYLYRTELAEGLYSDTQLLKPAKSLVLSDMVGNWHGQFPVSNCWYNCLFADYHVRRINATKVRSYEVPFVKRS